MTINVRKPHEYTSTPGYMRCEIICIRNIKIQYYGVSFILPSKPSKPSKKVFASVLKSKVLSVVHYK